MFLSRVVATYDNLLDMQDRFPDDVNTLLRNLLLFEADTQLYLLDANGTVLSSTGSAKLPGGFKVALAPVRAAALGNTSDTRMPYVMGDDPERMDANAVIAARALSRSVIRKTESAAGYLYLVTHKEPAPAGRLAVFRSAFAGPALGAVAAVVALTTLLAAWIIAAVIRPLRRISNEVARATRDGLSSASLENPSPLFSSDDPALALPRKHAEKRDEFDQLRGIAGIAQRHFHKAAVFGAVDGSGFVGPALLQGFQARHRGGQR